MVGIKDYFNKENYVKMKKRVLDWLPNKLIDAHVHTATEVRKEKRDLLEKSILNKHLIKQGIHATNEIFHKLFPKKEIKKIGFPLPLLKAGVEQNYVNELIIEEMKKGLIGCMLVSKNLESMEKQIKKAKEEGVKFYGLKFHPWIFREIKTPVFLEDYFNDDILSFCEKHKLTLITELPNGWNKSSIKVLKNIVGDYKINIIIPHLGFNNKGFVFKFKDFIKNLNADYSKFKETFEKIKDINNLFFDTSMVIDTRIIKAAFEVLGENRIIWGDDFPHSFTPKIREMRPSKKQLGKDLNNIVNHNAENVKHPWKYYINFYQQLNIIKNAVPNINETKLFSKNAQKIYNIQI